MAAHVKGKAVSKGQRISSHKTGVAALPEFVHHSGTAMRQAFAAGLPVHMKHARNPIYRALKNGAGLRTQ